MKKLYSILLLFVAVSCSAQFQFGYNPGWWGTQYTNPQLGLLARAAGITSGRFNVQDAGYVQTYGGTVFNSDFAGYQADGLTNNVAFLGTVDPYNQLDSVFTTGDVVSKVWRGLYHSYWIDSAGGVIDTANRFAVYAKSIMSGLSPNIVKYWEIINEQDQTGAIDTAGGFDNFNVTAEKARAGNWWLNMPSAYDLTNLKAPFPYYIRILRIAKAMRDRFSPGTQIAIGGIGYPATLDCIYRYTDNPSGGTVTSAFPLKGGAYFDVVDFHTYPMYNTYVWPVYHRHSDFMIDVDTTYTHQFDSVQNVYGYSKPYISTETDIPQDSLDDGQWGSLQCAINYIIKWNVVAQTLNNPLLRIDKYGLGSAAASNHASEFNHMGLYAELDTATFATAPKTMQFYGYLTMTQALNGKHYNPILTAALSAPSNIRAYAFSDNSGNTVYVMWAKTTTDLSEGASASYTFPFAFSGTRKEWDFTYTNTTTSATQTVALTGNPAFFLPSQASTAIPASNNSLKANYSNGLVNISWNAVPSSLQMCYSNGCTTIAPAAIYMPTNTGQLIINSAGYNSDTLTITAINKGYWINQAQVNYTETAKGTWILYNSAGTKMQSGSYSSGRNTTKITTTNYPHGVYDFKTSDLDIKITL